MKILAKNYIFDPLNNKVTIDGNISANQLLLITNITLNTSIYVFNNSGLGLKSIVYDNILNKTTFELNYDCSEMVSVDVLQIFYESYNSEKVIDIQGDLLVQSKLDSSADDNIYETLERDNNLSTVYKKDPTTTITVSSINQTVGNSTVLVTTQNDHLLSVGSLVIIENSISELCNGSFVILSVPTTKSFTIMMSNVALSTRDIKAYNTKLYEASPYRNSVIDCTNIITDKNQSSKLTVTTNAPLKMSIGASVILTNVVKNVEADIIANPIPSDPILTKIADFTLSAPTDEVEKKYLGAYYPYWWEPYDEDTLYFTSSDCTVAANQLTFNAPHGLIDNTPYVYDAGIGNTPINLIGAVSKYLYVRVVSPTVIYFTAAFSTTTKILITTTGTNGGITRQKLIKAYMADTTQTAGASSITFINAPTNWVAGNLVATVSASGAITPSVRSGGTSYGYHSQSESLSSVTQDFKSITGVKAVIGDMYTSNTTGISCLFIRVKRSVKSIFIKNHGLQNEDYIYISTNLSAEPTTSMSPYVNGVFAQVTVVNSDRIRIRMADSGAAGTQIFTTALTTSIAPTAMTLYKVTNISNSLPDSFKSNVSIPNGIPVIFKNKPYYIVNNANNEFFLSKNSSGSFMTLPVTYNAGALSINPGLSNGSLIHSTSSKTNDYINKYVYNKSATTITLHFSKSDALTGANPVKFTDPAIYNSVTDTWTKTNLTSVLVPSIYNTLPEDLISPKIEYKEFGSIQGNISNIVNDNTFEIQTNQKIDNYSCIINPKKDFDLIINTINIQNHGLSTGSEIYFTNSSISDIINDSKYYVILVNEYSFKIALTYNDSINNIPIILSSTDNVDITLNCDDIYSVFNNKNFSTNYASYYTTKAINSVSTAVPYYVYGTNTLFASEFIAGDTLKAFANFNSANYVISNTNIVTNELTISGSDFQSTGIKSFVIYSNDNILVNEGVYYINVTSITQRIFKIYNNPADASTGDNFILFPSVIYGLLYTVNVHDTLINVGQVTSVLSDTQMSVSNECLVSKNKMKYLVPTRVNLASTNQVSVVQNKPYVDITLGRSKNGSIVRQSQQHFKLFNKEIFKKFDIIFKPYLDIDSISLVSGTVAKVTTEKSHRLKAGLKINIQGANTTIWNGEFTVVNIIDENSFTISLTTTTNETQAYGDLKYSVKSWTGSNVLVGSFTDQSGVFFKFNGSDISIVYRYISNISGYCSVLYNTNEMIGVGTQFTSLNIGDKIVANDIVFDIVKINSDTSLNFAIKYIGASLANVKLSKVNDKEIPRNEWIYDNCDGLGTSNHVFDPTINQTIVVHYTPSRNYNYTIGFVNSSFEIVYVHALNIQEQRLPIRYEITTSNDYSYSPIIYQGKSSVTVDSKTNYSENLSYYIGGNSSAGYSLSMVQSVSDSTYGSYGLSGKVNRQTLKLKKIQQSSSIASNLTNVFRVNEGKYAFNYPKIDSKGIVPAPLMYTSDNNNPNCSMYMTIPGSIVEIDDYIAISNSIMPGNYAYPNGFGVLSNTTTGVLGEFEIL